MQFLAQHTSTMTDIPTMVLHPNHITHLIKTYRIQMTRNRFLEIYLSCIIRLLNQTITPTIVIRTGKHTILIIDNRSDFLARWIEIRQTLCFHHGTCLFGHIRKDNRQYLAYLLFLFISQRSTCISLNATTTAAFIQIAAEVFLQDI